MLLRSLSLLIAEFNDGPPSQVFSLHAKAQFSRIVLQQASFPGFMDCFWHLAVACLIGAPIIFLTHKIPTAPSSASAH